MSTDSIELRVAHPDEVELVRTVLRTIYYPEEAITISYVHGTKPTADDEQFSLSFVAQGMVILAEEKDTKSIVGISIAGPIEPGDPDRMIQEAATTETKKWSDILKLLALLERNANVCGRYGLSKAYHVHILAVDPACRGHSLGVRLMQSQIELAQKFGFGAISADFTSVYSAKIADKLGMENISQLSLADYRDEKGDKLFDPQEIHRFIKTCVKILS